MDEEIKKLLEQNYQLTREIFSMVKYIKRYIFWSKVYDLIKILVIIIPLILATVYLTPMLKDALKYYQDLSGMTGALGNGSLDNNLKSLPSSFENLLK